MQEAEFNLSGTPEPTTKLKVKPQGTNIRKVKTEKAVVPVGTRRLEIRPLDKQKWHGLPLEQSIQRPFVIRALVGPENTYTVDFENAGITKEEIARLEEAGYNLNVQHNPRVAHPLWDGNMAKIKLEPNTQFLEISSDMGKIRHAILLGSRFVANSQHELEMGLWPDATHVIIDVEAESEVKATKIEAVEEVIEKLTKVSTQRKKEIIFLLDEKLLENKSDKTVKVAMHELAMAKPFEVLAYLEKPAKEISISYLIQNAIYKSKISSSKAGLFFGDMLLGYSVQEATNFLMEDRNQELRERIQSLV